MESVSGGDDNTIQNSIIGLNVAGNTAAGNSGGITIYGGSDNLIGGTSATARNIISGNTSRGITINDSTSTGNMIYGNYIGTDYTGLIDIGNEEDGLYIKSGAQNNYIGGENAGEGNVISGNNRDGISLLIHLVGTGGNTIKGNYIGVDKNGTSDLGNTRNGISIYGPDNIIGGLGTGARNIISGNGSHGIYFGNTIASGNVIQNNYIGLDVAGSSDIGNDGNGIFFDLMGEDNTIGGSSAGHGNKIWYNGGDGIAMVYGWSVINNEIKSNSIYNNDQLGIDLENNGVTANDTGDGDLGANKRQNYPVISSVIQGSSTVTINGSLNSAASSNYDVQFFYSTAADSSGNGEGEVYIGTAAISTDGTGNVTFSETFSGTIPGDTYVTSTATDVDGNTSEFSGQSQAPEPASGTVLGSMKEVSDLITDSTPGGDSNHTISFTITNALAADGSIKIVFDNQFDLTGTALGVEDFDFLINSAEQTLVTGEPGASEVQLDLSSIGTGEITFDLGSSIALSADDDLVVRVGSNASSGGTGDTLITNPSSGGSYDINITSHESDDGSGSTTDYAIAVIVVLSDVTVSASVPSSLIFTVAGVTSGNACANSGGNATVTSTASSIPFGLYSGAATKIACQTLTVSTNATNGFVVTLEQDQDLTSAGSDTMKKYSGTYASPTTWASPPGSGTESYFGFTTDDTDYAVFQTSKYSSIAANDTPYALMSESGPVSDEANVVSYQLEVTDLQEVGTYSNTVMYIATATF